MMETKRARGVTAVADDIIIQSSDITSLSHTHTHTHTHTRTHARTHARTRTHAHAHTRTHTHTHARTRTHTHVCFCELWGLFIGVMVLYCTNHIFYRPTSTLPPYRKLSALLLSQKISFCMIYKLFEIWGHGEMSSYITFSL